MYYEADDQCSPHEEACQVVSPERDRILIIDDDFTQADALSFCFRKQGYEVSIATTCCDGMTSAFSQRPDVVVLDLALPDGDGLDVCAELADHRATADVPIVIVSGSERPDIVRRTRTAGCHFFVRKPYDPNALLILVQQAIADSRDW